MTGPQVKGIEFEGRKGGIFRDTHSHYRTDLTRSADDMSFFPKTGLSPAKLVLVDGMGGMGPKGSDLKAAELASKLTKEYRTKPIEIWGPELNAQLKQANLEQAGCCALEITLEPRKEGIYVEFKSISIVPRSHKPSRRTSNHFFHGNTKSRTIFSWTSTSRRPSCMCDSIIKNLSSTSSMCQRFPFFHTPRIMMPKKHMLEKIYDPKTMGRTI
jgi:hypothetical protein